MRTELKKIKDKLTLKNIAFRRKNKELVVSEQVKHILQKENIDYIYM